MAISWKKTGHGKVSFMMVLFYVVTQRPLETQNVGLLKRKLTSEVLRTALICKFCMSVEK